MAILGQEFWLLSGSMAILTFQNQWLIFICFFGVWGIQRNSWMSPIQKFSRWMKVLLSIYIQTCQKLWTPNFQVAQECHIWLRSKFEIACKVWHVKIKVWMVKKNSKNLISLQSITLIVPMPLHKCKCQCQCHYTHLTLHFMCWLTLAQPMDATAVVCQEPALAQPMAIVTWPSVGPANGPANGPAKSQRWPSQRLLCQWLEKFF